MRRRLSSFSAALPAVALCAASAHAQGLGGLIDKAKAKAGEVGKGVTQGATQGVQQQATGELPDSPSELTVENQQQYARAMMADARPVVLGQGTGSPTYYYRQLHQQYHMPTVFTWDEGAVKYLTEKRMDLWAPCRDISDDLVGWLGSTQGEYLKGPLSRVREIHLTTTPKRHDTEDGTHLSGYFLSYNPATQVLTAAMSTTDGINSVSADNRFGRWIQKNVK